MNSQPQSQDLPPGWVQGIDPNYQRPYYFNKHTRRSTWTKPMMEHLQDEHKVIVNDHERVVERTNGGIYSRAAERTTNGPAQVVAEPLEARHKSDLQSTPKLQEQQQHGKKNKPVWIEVYSPEHRRTYFFNRATKESRWTKPPELEYGLMGNGTSATAVPPTAPPQQPALKDAWKEIEEARKELQREREMHANRLKEEWKVLQTQIQQLREMSINSSFTPAGHPKDMTGLEDDDDDLETDDEEEEEEEETDLKGQDAKNGGGEGVSKNKKSSSKQRDEQGGSAEQVEERKVVDSVGGKSKKKGGAYTAGLLSELEDYADSLMRRRESITNFSEALGSGSGGGKRSKDESARILKAARKARRQRGESGGGGSDDDSEFDEEGEFDKDAYIASVLEGMEGKGGSKSLKKADSDTLIPYAIEQEMKDVDAGFKAVMAEAEAVGKAHKELKELDEGGYYRLLGVQPDATPVQLKKAYHKAMMVWHPDKFQGKDRDEAHKKTAQLGQAYNVLSDEWERFCYDIMGVEQYLVHANVIQCFINFIVSGVPVKKHPRKKYGNWKFINRQFVKRRILWLSAEHDYLCTWRRRELEPSPEQIAQMKRVKVEEVYDITKGIKTEVFENTGSLRREHRYLSIHTEERSLDLEAPDFKQREFLCSRLTLLVIHLQKNKKWFEKFYEERNPKRRNRKKKKRTRVQSSSSSSRRRSTMDE